MVKATSRVVHHAFGKYLDLAHEGEQVVITKRGKPWARLVPIPAATERRVAWPDVAARARSHSGGKKVGAVAGLLRLREEERW